MFSNKGEYVFVYGDIIFLLFLRSVVVVVMVVEVVLMMKMIKMLLLQGSLEEWLRLLRLEEYGPCLVSQGYSTVQEVATISIEDLEVSSQHSNACNQPHGISISRSRVLNAFSSIIVFQSLQLIIISPGRTLVSTDWATRSD